MAGRHAPTWRPAECNLEVMIQIEVKLALVGYPSGSCDILTFLEQQGYLVRLPGAGDPRGKAVCYSRSRVLEIATAIGKPCPIREIASRLERAGIVPVAPAQGGATREPSRPGNRPARLIQIKAKCPKIDRRRILVDAPPGHVGVSEAARYFAKSLDVVRRWHRAGWLRGEWIKDARHDRALCIDWDSMQEHEHRMKTEWVPLAEATRLACLSQSTLRERVRAGVLRSPARGYIERSGIEALIEERRRYGSWLTLAEAEKRSGCCRSSIRQMIRAGDLNGEYRGGSWWIDPESLSEQLPPARWVRLSLLLCDVAVTDRTLIRHIRRKEIEAGKYLREWYLSPAGAAAARRRFGLRAT